MNSICSFQVLGPSLPPAAMCGYSYPISYLGNAASGIPFGYSCDQTTAANALGMVNENCFGTGVPSGGGGGAGSSGGAAAGAAAATAAALSL